MNYLQSNLSLLARRQPELASHLGEIDSGKVEVFISASKRPAANYRVSSQKLIPLHSKYDPLRESRAKLKEFDVANSDYIVLLGFGLGYLLDALLELDAARDKRYFVIESDPSILRAAFEARDLSGMLSLPHLHFAWPISVAELAQQWRGFFDPVHARQNTFVMHPPSLLIDAECFKAAAKAIQSQTLQTFTDINTLIARADEFLENFIKNLRYARKSPGVNRFAGKFRKIPAIIVSAGPSLDRNIHELRSCRDRAIILSTDTATKPLLKAGIEPHFILTGDPSKANYLHLADAAPKEAYLVAEATAYPACFEEYEGRTISCTYHDSAMGALCDLLGSKGKLRAWGSVATMAFDFALLLGCDPVIFIGQDLAYSNGRTYCSGVYFIDNHFRYVADREMWQGEWKKFCELGKTVAMRDVFDKPVMTTDKLASYWNWFIKELSLHPDVQFINATEGGILKENTPLMSLRDALYRYCQRDLSVSRDIPAIFAGADRKRNADNRALIGLKQEFEQVRELVRQGRDICRQSAMQRSISAVKQLEAVKAGIYANAGFAEIVDAFNQMGNVIFLRKMSSVKTSPIETTQIGEIISTYSEYLESVAQAIEKLDTAFTKIEEALSMSGPTRKVSSGPIPDPNNPYTKMQKVFYESEAKRWTPESRDPVVGTFDAHNTWADYEILFEGIETKGMKALDFGCGPGRCLVKYADRFSQLDGADLDEINLKNAAKWIALNGVKQGQLFHVNGCGLNGIPSECYDLVYSVICLQHICVHDIRKSIMQDIYRVLRPGGIFTFQMAAGGKEGFPWVTWYENKYDAQGTNGLFDVSITDTAEVGNDLRRVGFKMVKISDLRPPGPGDAHRNWLFIKAWK